MTDIRTVPTKKLLRLRQKASDTLSCRLLVVRRAIKGDSTKALNQAILCRQVIDAIDHEIERREMEREP